MGGAARRCARGRDRPRPRVRHRGARDDAALPRAARASIPRGSAPRRRLRLRRALDRRRAARFRPGGRGRRRRRGGRGDAANAAQNGVEVDVRSPTRSPTRCRPSDVAVANVTLRVGRGDRAAARVRAARHVGLPRLGAARAAPACGASTGATPRAGRRICSCASRCSSKLRAVATFSASFLGCKVSQTDAQALRERLLADGHTETGAGADVAVVNTCCVTHEAVAKSRKAAARAARTHGRVYVTGCAANLSTDAFAGLPENVVVVRPAERGDARLRRGRRRRDRLRPGRRRGSTASVPSSRSRTAAASRARSA